MRALLTIATLTLAAAGVPAAMGQAPAVNITKQPGGAAASRIERMTATISAIESKTRQVTLKRPDGGEVTVSAIAEVVDLDDKRRNVTLRGPRRTVELPVNDPEQFKRLAKGDNVDATYTEAFAVALYPAK